jgi:DNA-binding response OmpR family regulator
LKILLVDDSNMLLLTERRLLTRHDYGVVMARDGLEAVQKATAEKLDLILMDVVMPRMDGFSGWTASRRAAGCAPRRRPGASPSSW